jgi:hypothetical protein
MAYSSLGRKRFWTSIAVLAINVINLGLSGRVNYFQEFFYVADQFPFALSIITLVMYGSIFAVDMRGGNAFIVRAPFLITFELLLCIFWTAGNAFSTSRWRHIPLQCDEIPKDFSDERSWCKDLQALKSFVWIEWVILVITFIYTCYYVIQQHRSGNSAVWSSALSREANLDMGGKHFSEFLQYPAPSPQANNGPTPIAAGFVSSRGREDMTTYQTNTHRSQQSRELATQSGDFAAAAEAYVQPYTEQPAQAQAYTQPAAQSYNTQAFAGNDYPRPPQQYAQGGYGQQYYAEQPDMPPNWVNFEQGEQRGSVAGGPGLAGVGARATPGAYGGFERM